MLRQLAYVSQYRYWFCASSAAHQDGNNTRGYIMYRSTSDMQQMEFCIMTRTWDDAPRTGTVLNFNLMTNWYLISLQRVLLKFAIISGLSWKYLTFENNSNLQKPSLRCNHFHTPKVETNSNCIFAACGLPCLPTLGHKLMFIAPSQSATRSWGHDPCPTSSPPTCATTHLTRGLQR